WLPCMGDSKVRRFLLPAVLAWMVTPIACGGSSDAEGSKEYALDDVCEAMAPRICASSEACCGEQGYPYDQAECEGNAVADCEKNVAKAKNGELVYHADQVEACVSVIEQANQDCAIGAAGLIELAPQLAPCHQVFVGTTQLGDDCTTDA